MPDFATVVVVLGLIGQVGIFLATRDQNDGLLVNIFLDYTSFVGANADLTSASVAKALLLVLDL